MLFSFLTLCSLTKLKIKYFFLKLGYKDLSDKNAITIPVIFLQNVKNVKNKAYQKVTFLALVIEILGSISITVGKFETLGSNFSHEIRRAKLLAS